jgi:uncharacterized protein YggT (Ycf19 family)
VFIYVILVISGVALAIAFALTLWTGRDGLVAGIGTVIFLVLAAYLAPSREVEGAGDPIDGAAGVAFALVYFLVPWVAGLLGARLVRRNRRSA